MTARHASKIVDAEVDCYVQGDLYVAEVNLTDVDVAHATVSVSHWSQESAIRDLILECYRVRCAYVSKRARYACEECGSRSGLQIHHKVFRSHGRKDTVDNLTLLCHTHHEDYHSKCHKSKTSQVAALENLRRLNRLEEK